MFRRHGPLSPALLTSLLLYQVRHGERRGYARMLEAFWDDAETAGLELPQESPVTAQAFSSARRKLPPELLRELLVETADAFDQEHGDVFRFQGRRLLAVDSARRFVRRSPELLRHFGTVGAAHYPQMHLSTLFDVCAKTPVDAVVGPVDACDRQQLSKLLDSTRDGDVIVLDRGYPSFDVFVMLMESGLDFVCRVPIRQTFPAVMEFIQGTARQATVEIWPPRKSVLQGFGPIRLRVVREHRRDAAPWILLTTLGEAEFGADDIAEVYRRRWQVEEFYKLLVARYFGQGHFHAKWVGGVEQEVYAQLLFVAITRSLMAVAARDARVPYEHLAQKAAILAVADHLTRIVLQAPPRAMRRTLRRVLQRIARARDKPRPGRSWPRRSFKPQARWTSAGRRGGA